MCATAEPLVSARPRGGPSAKGLCPLEPQDRNSAARWRHRRLTRLARGQVIDEIDLGDETHDLVVLLNDGDLRVREHALEKLDLRVGRDRRVVALGELADGRVERLLALDQVMEKI